LARSLSYPRNDSDREPAFGALGLANCRISLVLISRLFFMAGSTHYEVSIWGMDAIPGNPSRAVIAVALMQRLVVFESYLVGLVSAMVDPSTLPVGAC
jgi:hypothetical protein